MEPNNAVILIVGIVITYAILHAIQSHRMKLIEDDISVLLADLKDIKEKLIDYRQNVNVSNDRLLSQHERLRKIEQRWKT